MSRITLASFAADYSSNARAIRAALAEGYRIDKHADPIEGAREGLTEDEAVEVAEQDASLLVLSRLG
jgi:hypothetical protein